MRKAILALGLALFSASAASAQERIDRQLALARICASEAGMPSRGQDGQWQFAPDCAAIHSVFTLGAQRTGLSYLAFARAYSGRLFDSSRTDRRAWLSQLDAAGTEPSAWPRHIMRRLRGGETEVRPHAPWSHYRAAWLALYEHAGRILAGEVVDQCDGDVSDWGGDMDTQRAERLQLIPVSCGQTHNNFYLRPSWARPRS